VLDLIDTAPKLGATLAVAGENIVHTQIFSLKQLVPQIMMFCWVKDSPNPFNHQGGIEKSCVNDS
jgi:hypothetical protein